MRGSGTIDDIGLMRVMLDTEHQGDTTGVLVKELFDTWSIYGESARSAQSASAPKVRQLPSEKPLRTRGHTPPPLALCWLPMLHCPKFSYRTRQWFAIIPS
jgi:hypothetical protein